VEVISKAKIFLSDYFIIQGISFFDTLPNPPLVEDPAAGGAGNGEGGVRVIAFLPKVPLP
jgi:hypothetical protein